MSSVAIFGAGELGGALAHLLARSNAARDIRLIDDAGRIAAGKALDISQAGPIEGHACRVEGSIDFSAASGASLVILADRSGRGEWQGDDGLALLKQLRNFNANPIVVCAGASQRELIDRATGELRMPRERCFGSAPEALTAAARALVALDINGSPADVSLTVLGVPPSQIVVPWEEATIGGFSAIRVLGEPGRRRIAARLPALWPPGPYAMAAAAVKAVQSILGTSRQRCTCFVGADRSSGVRTRAAALPVRLGMSGIEEVVLPELSVRERVALDNAMSI